MTTGTMLLLEVASSNYCCYAKDSCMIKGLNIAACFYKRINSLNNMRFAAILMLCLY